MGKKINIGVDEFTLTLHSNDEYIYLKDWGEIAKSLIIRFTGLSKLTELFGEKTDVSRQLPAGYNCGSMYESLMGYFAIAYNESFPKMGVIVKFSAEAWAWYQKEYVEKFGIKIQINNFLHMVTSTLYRLRLTRIDITADYIDYGEITDPNHIFENIKNERVIIVDHNGRKTKRKLTDYGKDNKTQSIMIGSRKANTKALLRIYDKKAEQTERFGFRYFQAVQTSSWTRFEASYRGDYAHNIGQELVLDIKTDIELSQYLASKILDKYRFVDKDGNYTEYTKDLIAITENSAFPALHSETPKNNSLKRSILYLIKGSGLFPTLFKFRSIWGAYSERELIDYLLDIYNRTYVPEFKHNRALIAWIKKNYATLKDMSLDEVLTYEDVPEKTRLHFFDLEPIKIPNPGTPKYQKTENLPIISDEAFDKLFEEDLSNENENYSKGI